MEEKRGEEKRGNRVEFEIFVVDFVDFVDFVVLVVGKDYEGGVIAVEEK